MSADYPPGPRWADYSAGRPGAAALKAAGFVGVIRYVGAGSPGKRITADEYRDIVNAGLRVLLVYELNTDDAWRAVNNRVAGQGAAIAARADARRLGIPDSVPILAAADAHATAGQVAAAVAYARGFQDILGRAGTGFYGFVEVLGAVRAADIGSIYWLAGSAPGVRLRSWVHLWQRNDGILTVAGVPCDINEEINPIPEGLVMDWSDVIGNRQDGSPITAADALVNLYLGAYYGGGAAGAGPVFATVNALSAQFTNLKPIVADAVSEALAGATVPAEVDVDAVADAVLARAWAKLSAAGGGAV